MQFAYNAYVTRVLEAMANESSMSATEAKRMCRENLQFIETSYLNLADTQSVARTLLAN